MASIAICPHCYLQLIVPDGIERDEPVECPTCAKEFDLEQAVLRAIPEVVRRKQDKVLSADDAIPTSVKEINDMVEAAAKSAAEQEAHFVEEVKTRIEAELAAGGLQPGAEATLTLDLPDLESDEQAANSVESAKDDFAAWFRANEVPSDASVDIDLSSELARETDADDDAMTPLADESAEIEEVAEEIAEAEQEIETGIEEVVERIDAAEILPAAIEPRSVRPSATTLADLLPPREEFEPVPGPSFDLPNVPLTPTSSNGATTEIDPSMSFGPAAETEFALDDVDFESVPTDETAEEVAETDEPVFSEPSIADIPAAPFVLPGIPRPCKKRSVVRTLVGTALGGMVGLTLGYFVLLYLLGRDGDLLHVAQYLPDAVLPSSLKSAPAQIAANPASPAPSKEATDSTGGDESVNVPAGYMEEIPATDEPLASDDSATEDRYGTEPSPLDEPAAEPIADDASAATIAPLPLRGPTYTIDQLATALEASEQAATGLVAGDLSDAAVRRTKGMSYAKLCDLADVLTFVDRSSPSVESEQAIEGADHLFRETLTDARTQNEVARIADIWIDSPHRRHGGIFLAGTVSGGQIAGDVYEYQLTPESGSQQTLLMSEPLDPLVESSTGPLAIVGTIVDKPAEQVAGYRGTAKRAIWVARAIPLD